MINRSLFLAVLISFIVELSAFILLTVFYNAGEIVFNTYLLSVLVISFLCKTVFYVIIIRMQSYQKRYLLICGFSIVTTLAYIMFTILMANTDGSNASMFSDLSIVAASALIFVSVYVSLDESVYRYVKYPLVANAILLLFFKTPLVLFTEIFVVYFFGYFAFQTLDVTVVLLSVEYLFFGILTIFNLRIARNIDYL